MPLSIFEYVSAPGQAARQDDVAIDHVVIDLRDLLNLSLRDLSLIDNVLEFY